MSDPTDASIAGRSDVWSYRTLAPGRAMCDPPAPWLATDRTEALVRKIVLIADLFALIGAAMWFGSYRWWMFYGFLAAVVVIETSCKYLRELQRQSRDDE